MSATALRRRRLKNFSQLLSAGWPRRIIAESAIGYRLARGFSQPSATDCFVPVTVEAAQIAGDKRTTGKPASMGKHGRRGRKAWFGCVWNTLSHVRGNGSKRLLEPDTQSLAGVDFGTESSSRKLAFLVSRPFGRGVFRCLFVKASSFPAATGKRRWTIVAWMARASAGMQTRRGPRCMACARWR